MVRNKEESMKSLSFSPYFWERYCIISLYRRPEKDVSTGDEESRKQKFRW